MSKMQLMQGDCLAKMKDIPDKSIDAVITDPPYGLGFMGKNWDSLSPGQDVFEECLRVLKPGGYLLSFGGTRTYHRMAVAIEGAGFEIRDMIEWVYGSGFPKSHNIGKAVDKLQGNEREVVGKGKYYDRQPNGLQWAAITNFKDSIGKKYGSNGIETKGTSEWEGWGTALKPAHEPICMARKPLSEKSVAENCLKWNCGGINIDESRVEANEELGRNNNARTEGTSYVVQKETMRFDNSNGKRFPANLIHDNSEEVRECFPNESERFFKSIIYQAKASKSERTAQGVITNNHPTVKPVALMEYLINMVTREGQTILDPFAGSGTTGVACKNLNRNFIGIELDLEYFKIAEKRIAENEPVESNGI